MSEAPDQGERDKALRAREQTVLIDAGAGAGKTTLLVERIISLIAPPDRESFRIPLSRIAAVTFTRRAAGELRLRVRARILSELAKPVEPSRRDQLLESLGFVDSAFIGTIHGFADRLLRLQPMKARLSPAYKIADNTDALIDETTDLLLHAVQSGTLAAELPDMPAADVTAVERTLQEALRAGLLVRSVERPPVPPKVGLDLLFRGFIEQRDRDLDWNDGVAFDRAAFNVVAQSFIASINYMRVDTRGTRWLVALASRLSELLEEPDDMALYELVDRIKGGLKAVKKTKDFVKKSPELAIWARFVDEFANQLVDPLLASMARSLAKTRHVVVRLYENVKTRHESLDSIDLLLALRNLVRDDLEARRFYQQMFDHVLVDELQDTDPLQAEIVLFLAEAHPEAVRWQDVVVGPGRLTLVGDPKQSIYRFRRADVGMYDRMRAQVKRGSHVDVRLSANFRSVPQLVDWANERFAHILGTSADRQFDPETGQVFHQAQVAASKPAPSPPVHHVSYGFANGEIATVGEARKLEGAALAAYLSWLVERSGIQIRDLDSDSMREIRWSDIAVLALATTNLRALATALDRRNIPHSMAGGTLFTSDPLHRQFVLGLRAIADRNDGVAEAALLRPPFFAIDLLDLIRAKVEAGDEAARRGTDARTWLRETRRQRFARSPGQTARAVLEETAIGRVAALGPNGEQRLRHLREICLQLELDAAAMGLDYDGVTASFREWVDHPVSMDPPRPVGSEALQVLTVHQAKGLEFPIVVLWDGVGQWKPHEGATPWRVDRDGTGWAMKTNDVAWEEPADGGRIEQERQYATSERRRLVYVAATRARDLLVVPTPTWKQDPSVYIHAELVADARPAWVHAVEPYIDGVGATWTSAPTPIAPVTDTLDIELLARWSSVSDEARIERHAPRSVTGLAKAAPVLRVGDAELEPKTRIRRLSRFGPLFGEVVHLAIGSVIARGVTAEFAVEQAARSVGLAEHHAEAIADVERAMTALSDAALVGAGQTVRIEYPIAVQRDGAIVTGYIDLLSASSSEVSVIDFKTDQPSGPNQLETYPEYVRQVAAYAGVVGAHRAAMLFTATGQLVWLPS